MSKFVVYTDGGCRGNGKADAVCAWAFIVYNFDGTRVGSKSKAFYGGTNNIAEMTAVLESIKWANKSGHEIEIYLDSNFVKQGCESWLWNWAKKGWVKADGSELLNRDLWKEIHTALNEYMDNHREIPTFVKVKGHSGDEQNDAVDNLCNVKMTELEMESM